MRRSFLAPFGAVLWLGLAVAGVQAEPATPTTTTPGTTQSLPIACQTNQPAVATATTATVAASGMTGDDQDNNRDDVENNNGQQMRACSDAVRDADEHAVSLSGSAQAPEKSEKHQDEDASVAAAARATTATTTTTSATATPTVPTTAAAAHRLGGLEDEAAHHGQSESHGGHGHSDNQGKDD